MKIVTLTDEEEKLVAKLRRDALRAKSGEQSAEVVRAAGWRDSVKAGEVVHCSESIPLVW